MTTPKSISNHVLEMKFMQRKREAEIRAKLQVDSEKNQREAQWVTDAATSNIGSVQLDDKNVGDFYVGRRSFRNFNPSIEQLAVEKLALRKEMKLHYRKLMGLPNPKPTTTITTKQQITRIPKKISDQTERTADISAKEMAKQYYLLLMINE
eukprot:TRINITY_DN115_c5_g1_i1.p1 TRINITY_DN115_c5_g1~~TRINITY_DN115_c5_g1_i1.p1  ORF type:complete len:152 (-),score=70.89 TRINITY_DN115_c5_g1_i1:7-462(-)